MRSLAAIVVLIGTASTAAAELESQAMPMSFSNCLAMIRNAAVEFGTAPINIVETDSYRMVRFLASDGSVLITCGEGKIILTRSDFIPGDGSSSIGRNSVPPGKEPLRNHTTDMSGIDEVARNRPEVKPYGVVRVQPISNKLVLLESFKTAAECNDLLFSKYWEESDSVACRALDSAGKIIAQGK